MKPGETGFRRIIDATGYSWLGLKAAFKHESAFRQELLLCLILAPIALWFADSGIEFVLLLGSLFLILIVELLNSGLEAVVDRFGGEMHKLSGRAKDIGSAAVFLSLINAAITWSVILWPKIKLVS